MLDFAKLLTPPSECLAQDALKLPDRRKGAIWHCPLARKNIGKGRKRPECLCAKAMVSTLHASPAAPEGVKT